jgi:hypothetical protein
MQSTQLSIFFLAVNILLMIEIASDIAPSSRAVS